MVYKQYFYPDQFGNRIPLGKKYNLPLKENESLVIGIEFEPEKQYKPIEFNQGVYNVELECTSTDGSKTVRFGFRVREQNIKAQKMISEQAKKEKRPFIISFPIIKT